MTLKTINREEFNEALSQLVWRFQSALEDLRSRKQLPVQSWEEMEIKGGQGKATATISVRTSYDLFVISRRILAHDIVRAIIHFDKINTMLREGGFFKEYEEPLHSFVVEWLRLVLEKGINEMEAFHQCKDRFEKYLFSESTEYKSIGLLTGFTSDIDNLLLCKESDVGVSSGSLLSIQLRRIDASEKKELSRFYRAPVGVLELPKWDILSSTHVFEIRYLGHPRKPVPRGFNLMFPLRTLLRIYKPGIVYLPYQRTFGDWPSLNTAGTISDPTHIINMNYSLGKLEGDDFSRFVKNTLPVLEKKDDLLQLLIAWLDNACLQNGLEHQFVFYSILAEILFNPSDRGELRQRIAMMCAAFISDDPAERTRINSRMKRAYDCRCDIVHTGTIKTKTLPVNKRDALLEELQIYVRRALKKLLLTMKEMNLTAAEILAQIQSNYESALIQGVPIFSRKV